MKNRNRFIYQPGLPLGKDGKRVTGGTEHIALSREAAAEGMVLLKNEKQVLPLAKGTKAAVFGKACVDYVKGGGGSGDVTVAYVRSLLDALRKKEAEGKVSIYEPLGTFYEKEVAKQYEELISYADLYDHATFEAKKMIVNQLIRRVDVYRGYQISVSFNFNLSQYFEGIDSTAC